jgi:hypothetical protein
LLGNHFVCAWSYVDSGGNPQPGWSLVIYSQILI